MSDENIVPLKDAPENSQCLSMDFGGRPTNIDLVTGHLFDNAGNSIGRWEPMDKTQDSEHCKALARKAHHLSSALTASSIGGSCISKHGDDYVRDFARQTFLLSNCSEKERTQMLDVGPADVHIAGGLPNFITGYTNEGPVADVYAPPVIVPKKSDYYWQYDRYDAFQRAIPQLGASASTPMEIFPRFGNTIFKVILRAIGTFVPTEVEANADAALRIKMGHLSRVFKAAILEREIRAQALARTSGNWNSATTLGAGYQYNGGPNSDPVKDFHAIKAASFGNPNAAIIPEPIWDAMCRNPAVRAYYAGPNGVPGIISAQKMAELLDFPEIFVSRMKYIDTSGALVPVWGNDIVVFRRPAVLPPVNQEDVCTAVTFRWGMGGVSVPDTGQFTPDMVDGRGWIVRQFFNQQRGELGGIQMVLVLGDAETQTSKYIGNLLINAKQ